MGVVRASRAESRLLVEDSSQFQPMREGCGGDRAPEIQANSTVLASGPVFEVTPGGRAGRGRPSDGKRLEPETFPYLGPPQRRHRLGWLAPRRELVEELLGDLGDLAGGRLEPLG